MTADTSKIIEAAGQGGAANQTMVQEIANAIGALDARISALEKVPPPVPTPALSGKLTNFTPGAGTSGSVNIDGVFYQFLNGGRVTKVDDYTLRFENRQGERASWDSAGCDRCQASGVFINPSTLFETNFLFKIDTTVAQTASWFVIAEMQDDPALTHTSPPWAVEIVEGTKLAFVVRWAPGNAAAGVQQKWVYRSTTNCEPNRDYNIRVQGVVNNAGLGGWLKMWVDGVEVGSYAGPVGYGNRNYLVFGLYRGTVAGIFSAKFSKWTVKIG